MKSNSTINSQQRNNGTGGFTLVELMIVVVIISILASIATVGYRKYIARARIGEAVAMLAEMSSKEQIYYLEFAMYLPLRADGSITVNPASPNENGTAFYPVDPDAATFNTSRTATNIGASTGWPGAWRSIGLRPRANALFCTYITNAGAATVAVPAGNLIGQQVLAAPGSTDRPWFYSVASCNLNGEAGLQTKNTNLVITSNSPELIKLNEGL